MLNFAEFTDMISTILPNLELKRDMPMSRLTSFRIGGPVDLAAFPKSEEELSALLKLCAENGVKPVILGAGTNVLAPDEGLRSLAIVLKDALEGMEQISETVIRVMAGVTMSRAAVFAAGLNLGGLEFAHGIPGTVGGGVYMNAGAYGGEIKDVCSRVRIVDMDGNARWISNEEAAFSYRHSSIEDNPWIVVAAEFELTPKPEAEVWEKMKELIGKRRASQPLDLPSAGSAFKRPVGGYAAALLAQPGLKGFRIGGAAVSEKHAGFVVNLGGATAADVQELLKAVSDKVYDHTGIRLEPEVRIW